MNGNYDVTYLLEEPVADAEELAWDHALDISGSVYKRMNELGMNKGELARRMNVDPSRVTRILKGNCNLTLKTLAKLEQALDFRLDDGFRYRCSRIETQQEDEGESDAGFKVISGGRLSDHSRIGFNTGIATES